MDVNVRVANSKIAPLTSLRFFAAAYVLTLHSGSSWLAEHGLLGGHALAFSKNGYLGVSFFFILSGFILHHVYCGKVWTISSVQKFAVARFARVYPVYLVSLILAGIFSAVAVWQPNAIAQFFLLQKWVPSPIFELPNWNGPAWTLSVELLFYLTFPLVSRFARKASLATVIVLGGGLIMTMLGLQSPSVPNQMSERGPYDWMAYVPLPLLRYPEFVYGILLCELSRRVEHPRWLGAAPWLVVGMIVAVLSSSDSSVSRGVAALAAILFGALIYVTAQSPQTLFFNILSSKWLVLLGGASYALYILQRPIYLALIQFLPQSIERALYYPVLVGASILIFLYFEEPLRSRLKHLANAKVALRLPALIRAD